MYDNIGKKIKILAKILFIIGAVASMIVGITLMIIDKSGRGVVGLQGLLWLLLGPIVAWFSSWGLYGLGELIEKVCSIEEKIHRDGNGLSSYYASNREYKAILLDLLERGLLTEKEYLEELSNIEQQ